MSVAVRPIRPDDHAAVGRLLVASYDDSGPFDEPYRAFLGRPGGWVPGTTATFVAELDGEVVGCVAFVMPGDDEFEDLRPPAADCGFRFLAVDPAAQGHGAGRALVERVVGEARTRGCRRMVLHSMEFMTKAHRLYDQLGFRRRPDLDVRFPSGTGVAFQLDLTDDAAEHFAPPGPVPDDPPWYEELWIQPEDAGPVC